MAALISIDPEFEGELEAPLWWGWLDKTGQGVMTTWLARLFVLSRVSLNYYAPPKGIQPGELMQALSRALKKSRTRAVLEHGGFTHKVCERSCHKHLNPVPA
jgi:hypothetical protein